VGNLFFDQSMRHYADDVSTLFEAYVGEGAHQSDVGASVNQLNVLLGE